MFLHVVGTNNVPTLPSWIYKIPGLENKKAGIQMDTGFFKFERYTRSKLSRTLVRFYFYTTVLSTTFFGAVISNRLSLAHAAGRDSVKTQAFQETCS